MYGLVALIFLSTTIVALGGIAELAAWLPRRIREYRERIF